MMPAIESGTSSTKHAASCPLGLPELTRQGVFGTNSRASMMSDIVLKNSSRLSASVSATETCDEFFNTRSEEHTSELQSHLNLVCRLPLEKKKLSCLCSNTPSLPPYG